MTREERDDLRRSASSEYAPGHGPNGPAWQSIVLRLLDAIDAAEDCRLVARFPCGECRGCREAEREQLERELAATKDCAGPVNGEDPCGECMRCLELELDQAKDCRVEDVEDDQGDALRAPCGECRVCLEAELGEARRDREQFERKLGELSQKYAEVERAYADYERALVSVKDAADKALSEALPFILRTSVRVGGAS